jgi:putative addiction module killer protein
MAIYRIEVYSTATGSRPFSDWLQRLPDRRAQARLLARLDRVAGGNLGDWRPIVGADGLAKLRDPYGPGFRIYFGFDAATIIVLLGGST